MAKTTYYTPDMNGSEMIRNQIKKRLRAGTILFGVVSLIFLIVAVVGMIIGNGAMFAVCTILLLPFLIPFIFFLMKYLHPERRALKKNPQLMQQADQLFREMNYQNDVVLSSPKYFALKTDISKVIAKDEVLQLYKRVVNTNYGTSYYLVVETVRGTQQVLYPKAYDQAVDEAVMAVAPGCPYVRLGFGDENTKYVEYMRTMWQETQKAKQGTGTYR